LQRTQKNRLLPDLTRRYVFKGDMKIFLILIMVFSGSSFAADTVEMDPNQINIGPLLHDNLPSELLARIKTLTDTFEIVDGISYTEFVNLYKRDLDPESNIVIYEEMARVYNLFCNKRCMTQPERMDVYRLVLLRSMYSGNEALTRVNISVVTRAEEILILNNYKLKVEPIVVYQK